MLKATKNLPLSSYFNKLHKLFMRDVVALEVNFHGQEECKEEFVSLIEATTSVPPNSNRKEADDVTNPYLGVVTAI